MNAVVMEKETTPGLERNDSGKEYIEAVLRHQVIIASQAQKIKEAQAVMCALDKRISELEKLVLELDGTIAENIESDGRRLLEIESALSIAQVEIALMRKRQLEIRNAPAKTSGITVRPEIDMDAIYKKPGIKTVKK